MVYLKPRFQSFEDYLAYDDGPEQLCELFNGELIEVPPESGFNIEIANLLFAALLPIVGPRRVRGHGLEIEVRGEPRNRYPDLTVIRAEHIEQLRKRNTIRLSMAPPILVVEVVSPGEVQRHRDYIAKRLQYEDAEIPEYWIINPQEGTILVLALTDQGYAEVATLQGEDEIVSVHLGSLDLKVFDILNEYNDFEQLN